MTLPLLVPGEWKSSVHSIDFCSENAVKTMETTGKYMAVKYESTPY
jgi:hypothetical protein